MAVDGIGGNYFNQPYYDNKSGPTIHAGWSPTVETDHAIRFMEQHKAENSNDPFALFLSWHFRQMQSAKLLLNYFRA